MMGFPFARPEGDPGGIRRAAEEIGNASSSAGTAKSRLVDGSTTALDGWNAANAVVFADISGQARGAISTAVTQLDTAPQPLREFATALQTAQDRYDELTSRWEVEQETIDSVARMAEPSASDRNDSSDAVTEQGIIEGQMQDALDDLRRKGDAAASALDGATNALVPGGADMRADVLYRRVTAQWAGLAPGSRSQLASALQSDSAWDYIVDGVASQVAPPDDGDPVSTSLWGAGRGLSILGGTTAWMSNVRHGWFSPRDAAGRYISPSGQSLWRTGYQGVFDRNWQARPYQSSTYARWGTVSRWGGRAGFVVSAGAAGWNQWSQDADNPNLDTSERVGRTAYRGAAVGAAAWGGAVLGAEAGAGVGAAIGSVVPGLGTGAGAVVGGVIGGIVGGVAASGVANAVVDETVDWVGDRVEDASEAVGDVADAVTFWD